MKHTPGPWEVKDWALKGGDGSFDFGQNDANARLIAASPTMFDFILRKAYDGDEDARRIVGGIDEGYTWPRKQETT